MQRAVVMTAVGIINHSLSLDNGTYKLVNDGNYLFTARQWLNLENIYSDKVKFDWGILSHAMTNWVRIFVVVTQSAQLCVDSLYFRSMQ